MAISDKMKKILILTASYGSGHLTAAHYLNEAIKKSYPQEVKSEIFDLVKIGNQRITHFARNYYEKSVEYFPFLWNLTYRLTNCKQIFKIMNLFVGPFYRPFYQLFLEKKPDLLISTHPYWNYILEAYSKKYDQKIKYLMVITDSISIHYSWLSEVVNYYFVPNQDTAEIITQQGVNPEKIKVFGFPVNPELGEPFNRNKFLNDLGLNPEVPTILFTLGLGKIEKLLEVIKKLGNYVGLPGQIMVICGKYKRVYEELSKRRYYAPTRIFSWVEKMADYLRAADLIVTKAGGAIVMECLAAGKPIIITHITPGQEEGNAELIKKHGLGFIETNPEKIVQLIVKLVNSPEKIKELQNRVKNFSLPNAAYQIAEFVKTIVV